MVYVKRNYIVIGFEIYNLKCKKEGFEEEK